MIDEKRTGTRFVLKFHILSNEIEGDGINISHGGFGFLTDEEIVPADDIPFKAELEYDKYKNQKFLLQGKGRLLFSTLTQSNNKECYYNGFEFIELTEESKKTISKLLEAMKK